ncbi:unnamed protein product, partial [Mesorhabditis belari]|uniref:CRAL-TRIO domain-containing protein n=1 Tax=Mesorhabditis belari TaxID=2138241 RepID=A0AAF3EYY3_9BILA
MGVQSKFDIHIDDLNDKQKEKIKELRDRLREDLKRYPEYDTDLSLFRWLVGWDYDIDAIVPKASWALSVFDNLGFNDFQINSIDDIHQYALARSPAVPYFPGGLLGYDKDGNVLYCQPMAKAHPKTLIKADSISQVLRLELAMIEGAFKLVRAQEAKTGRKCGMKIIMDLDGFSYSEHIHMPAITEYLKLLSLVQAVFPDFLRKLWVVNPPTTIAVVYNIVKPVLAKQTREKIEILGKDWKEILVTSCGAENLYPQWGGVKPAATPYGNVRLGGKVPEKVMYSPLNNPWDDEERMKSINVSARSKAEIRIQAEKGETIRWLFRVSSGDVDFSIRHNDAEVYPTFRISTEFVPEIGSMICRESGEYVILFENLHGKLWSKDVKYRVEVEEA